jgi:hypothetical protein
LSDKEIARRLFLVSLVHPPSAAEEAQILESLKNAKGKEARRRAFEDVLWSIFNSKAFLFNH